MSAQLADQVLERSTTAHLQARKRQELGVRSGIVALGAGLLLFWEFGLPVVANVRYTSTPSAVVVRLVELAREGVLWGHTYTTMVEATSGYAIGVAAGLLSALFLAWSQRAYQVFEPFLMAFYSIPKIALAPLFIMWFGLGLTPKILLAAMMVYFIVLMNTVAGIYNINPQLVGVSQVMGAGKRHLATKVVMPAAAPAIMASIRITFARAMVGAVLGEFIAAMDGLGFLIVRSAREFDVAAMFAGIVVIAVLVMAVNGLIRHLEARLLPWSEQEVRG
jgi:NitT/TauT family transport system permease protein